MLNLVGIFAFANQRGDGGAEPRHGGADVRFGSKADIRRIIRNVRLPLDSGHWPDFARCLLMPLTEIAAAPGAVSARDQQFPRVPTRFWRSSGWLLDRQHGDTRGEVVVHFE